jgi:hypothetical protein
MDSGRSWAIAGSASRNASAADPLNICLVRRCIARHIGLDRLHRNFIGAAGQKVQSSDQQKDNDDQ